MVGVFGFRLFRFFFHPYSKPSICPTEFFLRSKTLTWHGKFHTPRSAGVIPQSSIVFFLRNAQSISVEPTCGPCLEEVFDYGDEPYLSPSSAAMILYRISRSMSRSSRSRVSEGPILAAFSDSVCGVDSFLVLHDLLSVDCSMHFIWVVLDRWYRVVQQYPGRGMLP